MTANDKFKKLVDSLYKRTKGGSLDWAPIDGSNSVQIRIANRPIVLSKRESEFEETVITLFLYDTNASMVEKFTDEDLPDLLPYNDHSPFIIMEELFELASHKAKGVDENLDAILDQLDELDDDVPF